MRIKVSCSGPSQGRFWSALTPPQPLGDPKKLDLVGASCVCVVAFTKVWVMAGLWGLTCELKHCVFALSSSEAPELA